jgi:putative acetyltransferase
VDPVRGRGAVNGSGGEAPALRAYRHEDQPALERFLDAVFRELGRSFIPDGKDADVRDIPGIYGSGSGVFYIVGHDGGIGGSVGLRTLSPGTGELKRLYLARSLRGRGLGESLCSTLIHDARNMGFERIRLDTSPDSAPAIGLFRKLGFVEIDRYNDNPFASLFFEKALA